MSELTVCPWFAITELQLLPLVPFERTGRQLLRLNALFTRVPQELDHATCSRISAAKFHWKRPVDSSGVSLLHCVGHCQKEIFPTK